MNVPYTALHFAIYESAKKALNRQGDENAAAGGAGDEEGDEGLLVQVSTTPNISPF